MQASAATASCSVCGDTPGRAQVAPGKAGAEAAQRRALPAHRTLWIAAAASITLHMVLLWWWPMRSDRIAGRGALAPTIEIRLVDGKRAAPATVPAPAQAAALTPPDSPPLVPSRPPPASRQRPSADAGQLPRISQPQALSATAPPAVHASGSVTATHAAESARAAPTNQTGSDTDDRAAVQSAPGAADDGPGVHALLERFADRLARDRRRPSGPRFEQRALTPDPPALDTTDAARARPAADGPIRLAEQRGNDGSQRARVSSARGEYCLRIPADVVVSGAHGPRLAVPSTCD